jgi:hypothetical protein
MNVMTRWAACTLLAVAPLLCHAQGDVGLVNLVAGEVAFLPQGGGQPGKAKAYMKVRDGDRFEIPAGAQMRIVYFESSRQERWQGPAAFQAAKAQGAPTQGAPAEVQMLPRNVPQRMARVPELMQNARLGGIQVRGAATARRASDEALADARATYQVLRKDLAADDITPELFLFSALNDNQLYEEMAPLVDEMLRRQPASEDVKSLAAWLKTRRGR